jgi:RNA polymerase sigma factor (sigma-70 family)
MGPRDNGTGSRLEGDHEGFDTLIRRAQAGDRNAKDRICEKIGPGVLRLAMTYASLTRAVESAEDLAQQALMRICERMDTFVGGSDDEGTFKMFWCWSRRLTRNVCFNAKRYRRQKKRDSRNTRSLDAVTSGGPHGSTSNDGLYSKLTTPFTGARRAETRQRILLAIDSRLDDREARIVHLSFFRGLSLPEVADALDLEPEEVRTSWAVASRKLQPELGDLL